MKNTKLINLLQSLNKTEISKFEFFINSPLFNERETLCRFFDELIKYYPGFNSQEFTKENIFRVLYNNRNYNDDAMRNLVSRLYKLLENYLSFINFQKDEFNIKYRLLDELNNRGNEKLFKKNLPEIKRSYADDEGIINGNTFFHKHLVAYLERAHYDKFKHTHIIENNSLQQRENSLIEYFLVEITKIYSNMVNQTNLYPERTYRLQMLDIIEDFVGSNRDTLKDNFYFQIQYNMLMMLKKKDNVYYESLKLLLSKFSIRLSAEEKSAFYTAMHNYIQDRIFKGEQEAIREKFELYKESFANGGEYFEENVISHLSLINAVSYCMIVKDFNEAAKFLDNYLAEVEEYYRESTRNYCLALIDYYSFNYESVLKRLSKVSYDDISYKMLVKTLLLMTYFSSNETETFYSLVDSFRHFLTENKLVSEFYKELYINFINFTQKLFKGKENLKEFDIQVFKTELHKAKNVAKKHWLIEMTEVLEKKIK